MLLLSLLLLLLRRMSLAMIGSLTLLATVLFTFVAACRSYRGQCLFDAVAATIDLIWRNDHNPPGCRDIFALRGGAGRGSLGRVAHAGDLPSRETPVRCHVRTGRVEPYGIQGKPG